MNNDNNKNNNISTVKEIERKLWNAADVLRGSMSAEEYQHVVIGILSLKYISDQFEIAEPKLNKLGFKLSEIKPILFYNNFNSFIVPKISNWNYIKKYANDSIIGQKIDSAFFELEKINPILKGIFNKNYNDIGIDQIRLGEIVKIFSDINFATNEIKQDIIGRVYEYFLGNFFKKRGQKGGEFYTPKSIVKLMVGLLNPMEGTIYDPACGTAGILIQSKNYIKEHHGNVDNITVFGQEYNRVTWKLAKLNLLLNGFSLQDKDGFGLLGESAADTFINDQHKNRRFDFVMANPPFNLKVWGQEKLIDDSRWKWGLPPKGNANYAWLSHMVSKLNKNGKAATVLANGSLSSSQKAEKNIRINFLKDNKIDAIIQLPDKLFYTTGIPACIWIFNNNKKNNNILMVSGSDIEGNMISKKLRELEKKDISKIIDFYKKHLNNKIINEKGIAKTVTIKEIKENDYSFVPGQYVEIIEEVIDVEATKEEIRKSFEELEILLKEFDDLKPKIKEAIKKVLEDKNDKKL